MVIHDLEISELLEANNIVIGGNFSHTNAQTFTSSDSAAAIASGVAVGDEVFTNTRTLASVNKSNFSSINFGFADAEAGAKSNGSSALSSSTSISSNFTSNWQ